MKREHKRRITVPLRPRGPCSRGPRIWIRGRGEPQRGALAKICDNMPCEKKFVSDVWWHISGGGGNIFSQAWELSSASGSKSGFPLSFKSPVSTVITCANVTLNQRGEHIPTFALFPLNSWYTGTQDDIPTPVFSVLFWTNRCVVCDMVEYGSSAGWEGFFFGFT